MEKYFKRKNGITLVALVVTIVVLLILAGVSINLVLGNNGIIAKAKEARDKSAQASQNDLIAMNELAQAIEGSLSGNNGGSSSGEDEPTAKTLVEAYDAGELKIGDYVNYKPIARNSYPSITNENGWADQTYTVDTSTTWRVLGKEDNHILLISGSPIKKNMNASSTNDWDKDPYLYMKGAYAYVNCEKMLNDICAIYSTDLGTARSITIEDVNKACGVKVEGNTVYLESDANKTNIDESREALLQEIKSNGNKADENTTNINKNIKEVRNSLTESVTKLMETTDASLKTVKKESIDNIANQTKDLLAKLDNILAENKNSFDGNFEEIQKSRDLIVEKLRSIDEANQVRIKEYNDIVEGKLASTDERLIKEFANIGTSIANQTSELTEKIDTVIMENKSGSAANLEELQKTRDIIVDKITDVDEANQVKEQEYYNSVEEKLNASDDKVLREFANIKELAKEMEEKRTEADSTAFDGVHAKANEILSSSGDLANKLNMVSETLEGFEQRTVSSIAESSATVSQEVKDGVIQSTSHMNDVSEKVIETIQKNDNDTVEKLNHQRQEILSAISGSEIKAQENYDSLVGVLSEVKLSLNEVETEISNAEKGNAELTEELKKSIASELQNVGDELSKIEGIQKDNVVQIIELVDSKLLELNQELVKQANSILDKSDENTDYVSEKYNRVFDQIQSVAKESKILIKRVNDAIEENKNTIIQSQNAVTDSIGSHFQNVKNKEKELESLKAVVERNFINISSELEITRGQLSSLNSLSVLIKNLSEKREDKVEKKQNRIETIEDPDSGLTVKNEYKQDKLVTSQMFRGSKKVYDVFYGNRGEIVSTKNYDELGKVSLEMTYHSNGQVKERIEYISGKAELSKFDANGNKIK